MSQRVLAPASDPYEIGLEAMATIVHGVIDTAEHGAGAYLLWAELTDVADHPRVAGPEWCAALTWLAAREWLDVDTRDHGAVARYFEHWQDPMLRMHDLAVEPDSAWSEEYHAFLERTIGEALAESGDLLAPVDNEAVQIYLAADEHRLALEYLALVLCEDEVPVPERTLSRLRHLADLLSSEQAQRDLAELSVAASAQQEG